jgi:hypothetical protein
MACKVDGLHPHRLNKWRMQGISPKARWYFAGGESCSDAGEGPPERLDIGGIAMTRSLSIKYLGVVYQEERIMAGTRKRFKMQAA